MGIIIKKENDDFWLCNISHSPVVIQNIIQDCCYYIKIGKINDFGHLNINNEYCDLDCYKNFEIVDRIQQVIHDDGYIYDDLTYSIKK